MPKVEVVFHQESPGRVSVLEWLEEISKKQPKALEKLRACIERLEQHGYELSGPTKKILRDGIYELRVNNQSGAYRLLYFFHNDKAVLCHGVQKNDDHEKKFHKEIDKAVDKKKLHFQDPEKHTYYAE